jgi:nitrite reductase/ring-hydroxylating ferredoxin subunit
VGVVHALGNITALLMYSISLAMRRSGFRRSGRALSFAAFATASGSAYLGGHIAFGRGVGVDHNAFDHQQTAWKSVISVDALSDGKLVAADIDGTPLVLYRSGDRILALASRCSHRGGPLDEGDVDGRGHSVTCPWHASTFDLETGDVMHGPATAPQPAYEARARNGTVEVRLKERA